MESCFDVKGLMEQLNIKMEDNNIQNLDKVFLINSDEFVTLFGIKGESFNKFIGVLNLAANAFNDWKGLRMRQLVEKYYEAKDFLKRLDSNLKKA